jgi:hypothetical protein
MTRPLKRAWKHPAEVFYQLYKREVEAWIAIRWQALGVLRRGERLKQVKEVGVQMRVDSAGGKGVEGSRGVVWGCGAFPKAKAMGEGAVAGISSRPTLLSLILQSRYLRRFGGG